MRRLLVLAVAVLAVVTVTAVAPASGTGRSHLCNRLLPLTGNPISPSVRAALHFARRADRPLVTSAELATWDRGRGPEAKSECGARAWRRTVVVYITLRKFLPSASLSERVVFVGRVKAGYRVWQVVH